MWHTSNSNDYLQWPVTDFPCIKTNGTSEWTTISILPCMCAPTCIWLISNCHGMEKNKPSYWFSVKHLLVIRVTSHSITAYTQLFMKEAVHIQYLKHQQPHVQLIYRNKEWCNSRITEESDSRNKNGVCLVIHDTPLGMSGISSSKIDYISYLYS